MQPQETEQLLALLDARQKRRDRRWLILCGALVVAIPSTMLAASITVPNSFTAHTVAHAADVNANFAALTSEATRVSNIVTGPGDASNTNKVVGLSAPVASTDGANKAYVDAASGSGSGGILTLLGTTTCPSGWTTALSGTVLFQGGSTGGTPPMCVGTGVFFNNSANPITINDTTNVDPSYLSYVSSSGGLPYNAISTSYFANAYYFGGTVTFSTCVVCVQ